MGLLACPLRPSHAGAPSALCDEAARSPCVRGPWYQAYRRARPRLRSIFSLASRANRAPRRLPHGFTFACSQLVRVPKAGSSEISLIARRLGGCTPRGPCCNWPGDPPGSCPAKGLMCPAVSQRAQSGSLTRARHRYRQCGGVLVVVCAAYPWRFSGVCRYKTTLHTFSFSREVPSTPSSK